MPSGGGGTVVSARTKMPLFNQAVTLGCERRILRIYVHVTYCNEKKPVSAGSLAHPLAHSLTFRTSVTNEIGCFSTARTNQIQVFSKMELADWTPCGSCTCLCGGGWCPLISFLVSRMSIIKTPRFMVVYPFSL